MATGVRRTLKERVRAGWLIAGLMATFVCAAESPTLLRIAEPQITGLVEADGQGVYQRLVNAALEGGTYQIESRFFPFKRAMAEFINKRFDCLYSQTELAEKLLGRENVVFSLPLGQFGFYFFTRRGQLAPRSLDDLREQRLIGILGQIDYYQELLPGLEVAGVPSEKQAMGMITLGRADVYIGALPDLLPHVNEFSVALDHPLLVLEDRLTCHRSVANEHFITALNQRLQEMKMSGVTASVLGPFYFDPANVNPPPADSPPRKLSESDLRP